MSVFRLKLRNILNPCYPRNCIGNECNWTWGEGWETFRVWIAPIRDFPVKSMLQLKAASNRKTLYGQLVSHRKVWAKMKGPMGWFSIQILGYINRKMPFRLTTNVYDSKVNYFELNLTNSNQNTQKLVLENPTNNEILDETNQFVEKWSRIGVFFFKYVAVPSYMLLTVIVSFFIYFTTDVGSDAFSLPWPMW